MLNVDGNIVLYLQLRKNKYLVVLQTANIVSWKYAYGNRTFYS